MKLGKTKISMFALAMTIVSTTTVFASAGSYQSTYDMTGGVFSKSIKPSSYVKTTIDPGIGIKDASIGVIWAKEYWYGWDGEVKYLDSTRMEQPNIKLQKNVRFGCAITLVNA